MSKNWEIFAWKYYPRPTLLFLKGCYVMFFCGIIYSALTNILSYESIWLFEIIYFAMDAYLVLSLVVMFLLIPHKALQWYSDCMVDTYFFGYLRQIVPESCDKSEESIKERISWYQVLEGLNDEIFPFRKLFVLITKCGNIPTTLDKLDPNRIELRKDVIPILIDRAGVVKRQYKFCMYKIFYPDTGPMQKKQHITVAMVGAAQLTSLSESCREKPELRKNKEERTYLFYKKLLSKLNKHKEFKDDCELIYLDKDKQNVADYFIRRYLSQKEGFN